MMCDDLLAILEGAIRGYEFCLMELQADRYILLKHAESLTAAMLGYQRSEYGALVGCKARCAKCPQLDLCALGRRRREMSAQLSVSYESIARVREWLNVARLRAEAVCDNCATLSEMWCTDRWVERFLRGFA